MTKIDYSKLFSYINRGADRETREEVERWRRADARHEAFYKRACDYYRNDPTVNKSFSAEQLDLLFADMLRERRRRRRLRLSAWSSVAASILLLVAVGVWFLTDRQPQEAESPLARIQPSVPANEIVVITENGQRFTPEQVDKEVVRQVSAGKLEYRDTLPPASGNVVGNEVRVPTHTIVVPRGKTFELRLSDGTYVLLSPSSSLTYPVRFDTVSAREVALDGEAYFEVAKSSNRFVVNTQRTKLRVYGTVFNVLSRPDAPDETVLLEGSVGVTAQNAGEAKETVLRPGDKSTIDSAGHVAVAQVDLAEYQAKRDGFLLFNGKTVREVIRTLELYYDARFVEESTDLDDREFVFSFKRDESLRDALNVIEAVADVQFTITGKEVRVSSK